MNYILILTKYYIYKCRIQNKQLNIKIWQNEVKVYLLLEKMIAIKYNTYEKFEKKKKKKKNGTSGFLSLKVILNLFLKVILLTDFSTSLVAT